MYEFSLRKGGMVMSGVINICNTRINGMARNGSMNFGEVLHNGHTADVKSVGINSTYGDISAACARMKNTNMDADIFDQTAVANIDGVYGNQV